MILQAFSVQFAAFLAAKQALTHRTMLGCIISRHRIMMRDQPPLGCYNVYLFGGLFILLIITTTS